MSNNIWDHPEVTSELIEKSMRQARIERSKAVWEMLQSVFSWPEARELDKTEFNLRQSKLRLG